MPIVVLQGTPFERGRQHGARFRSEIAHLLAGLKSGKGEAYQAAYRRAGEAWPAIAAAAPDVAAEIEGMAEGAGAGRLDLLLRSGFELFATAPTSGCTAIAARGAGGGAFVAQNWDAPPAFAGELALFLHHGAGGFQMAIVASVGTLCWVGANRHGLAFVNNDLMLSAAASGLPSQIVRRLILAERSTPAAVALLQHLPHMGGRSYLLGDATGEVAGVEISARFGARANQLASPVLHTNHALDVEIAADESEAELMGAYPSSRHRYDVLRRIAPALISANAIATLLADRQGSPDAISKSASRNEPTATLFSVIFDCASQTLFLCTGAPHENPYQRVAW